ncbi:MAG: META domain-containing protein [Dysgonomonas sp.]
MKSILNTSIFLLCAAVISFGMQSCSSVKPIEKSKLEGNWTLKTLDGEAATDVFKTTLPTLQFNFAENRVSGNGGCNTYSGNFTLTDKNEFTAPNVIATMRACIDANKEPQYFAVLSTANIVLGLENNDKELTFTKDKKVLLHFEKSETKETTAGASISAGQLTGSWVLSTIAGGDINTLFTNNKPTMEIAEDGKIIGHAGCNSYRTSYTLEGNTITFSPAASTKMACPSLKGEGLFTSLLATPLQASVEGDKLSFLKDGTLVLEFVKNTEAK